MLPCFTCHNIIIAGKGREINKKTGKLKQLPAVDNWFVKDLHDALSVPYCKKKQYHFMAISNIPVIVLITDNIIWSLNRIVETFSTDKN